jgi:hypothetical protein
MTREFYEWANLWWENAPDTTSPRVMLIGDSITNGYKNTVQELLRERGILVDMAAGSRSVEDPALFAELNYVLGDLQDHKYKAIHFNNGLHGSHLTGAEYETGMRAAIKLIRSLRPEAGLILVTCTVFTPKGSEGKVDPEKNVFVLERNAIIMKLADEFGLPVDNLFAAVAGKAEYPQPDAVHYTDIGYKHLAQSVAESILPYII